MGPTEKRNALRQLKLARPPHSLNPMRSSIPDIMNIVAGLSPALPRTPWEVIEKQIARRCRDDSEEAVNNAVGLALYEYANEHHMRGRAQDFFSLALGLGRKLTYWSKAVIAIDDRPFIPFVDPRKSPKLSANGRRFVFSAMHEHIRAADPDFANVGLVIFQFKESDGKRVVVPHFETGLELFTFEQLDEMVRETYQMWIEVLEEREAEARRRGGGGRGSLL
jgi:hypothetical protein